MRAFIMRHPRAGQRVHWGFPRLRSNPGPSFECLASSLRLQPQFQKPADSCSCGAMVHRRVGRHGRPVSAAGRSREHRHRRSIPAASAGEARAGATRPAHRSANSGLVRGRPGVGEGLCGARGGRWLRSRTSVHLALGQHHRDMRRVAKHARASIGIGPAFERLQQKEDARPLAMSRHVSPLIDYTPEQTYVMPSMIG
jgi:hypothetical protein